MGDLDEIVKEFLIESFEGLDQLDRDLVALEASPTDQELLAAIFRCIHTIKGTCGFLGFTKLESITHTGESLLSQLRDGDIELTAELTSALLTMVDAVREILSFIEGQGDEGSGEYGALVDLLEALNTGARAAAPPGPPAPPAHPAPPVAAPDPVAEGPEPREERAVTTSEIGRTALEAAGGSADIAQSITSVATSARSTSGGAGETRAAAARLSEMAGDLRRLTETFQYPGAGTFAPEGQPAVDNPPGPVSAPHGRARNLNAVGASLSNGAVRFPHQEGACTR